VGRESQGARVEARATSPVDRQLVRHLRRPVSHPSSSKPPSVSASLLPSLVRRAQQLTPGIEIRPTTLIWLSTGSSAVRRASAATGLHASKREAPCVRSTSTVSLCELCGQKGHISMSGARVRRSAGRATTYSNTDNTWLLPSVTAEMALPSTMPSSGT
jgi:hypothetical protein